MKDKEKDLENTKPIEILSDLSISREEKYERLDDAMMPRSEKYKDAVIKEEAKEQTELAEEALAEKNIAEAEKLLEEEKKSDDVVITKIDTADIPKLASEVNEEASKEDKKKNKKEKVKKEKVEDTDDEDEPIGGFVGKLIDKWNGMSKKKRILTIVGAILGLILIVILIIFLILKLTEVKPETPKVDEPVEEVAPVVVDNYYYKDGKLFFLSESETELGNYECVNKDDKLCYVDTNVYQDDFDVTKLESTDGKLKTQRLPIYEDNYVFVYDNKNEKDGEIILYSMKENKEVARYLEVKAYKDNYVIVQNTEKSYGLIQINNGINEIIKPQYLYLGMIDGQDNLIAQTKKGYVVINKKNKTLSSVFDSKYTIKNYNANFVVVEVSEEYNVYDYKANLISGGYEFANVTDKYISLVKDDRVFIVDKDGNKYNENGVSLKNSNYVKTYVYDSNDQLTETKRSYDLNVKDKILEVIVYGKASEEPHYTNLNTVEALANAKYEYINYFEGKLYFYKEAEKKEVIGIYTCENENVVSKAEDEYTTCFLANDTIFEDNDMVGVGETSRKSRTPIINEKYVFVSDGSNNIVLYDLETNKNKSEYTKVNTYTANNDYKVTKYDGDVDVVAVNKKGKYGMISIEGDSVTATYKFAYNSMEKIGNYVLALDTSNSWRILYGNIESMGFENKIRGYNTNSKYFKIKENGTYYVYDSDGNKVLEDGFVYVELYGTYFAAVNDSKELVVYDYDGTVLTPIKVQVGDYKYYGVLNPAFKVKKDGDQYIASIFDGSKYNDTNMNVALEPEPEPEPEPTPEPNPGS